jgi:cytochrome d ubiquinol oxidase subunit I
MLATFDVVTLSRLQFALTAIFHMLWPVLSTGLAIYLVVLEAIWLRTRNPLYYRQARFWAKLYVLNFGIGVASGLAMEFQFGTNWTPLSEFAGDFFGSVLGFEGAMAFMLEAGFLGIMLFGWQKVPPVIHFLSTLMVAFGANLSVAPLQILAGHESAVQVAEHQPPPSWRRSRPSGRTRPPAAPLPGPCWLPP